jgi:hypothetical protein
VRTIFTTLAMLALLVMVVGLSLFLFVMDPPKVGRMAYLEESVRLFLYNQDLVAQLTESESKRLYTTTCSRKCHGRDVIERKPRSALEWHQTVERMRTTERAGKLAGFSKREGLAITAWLQKNHLSNVPTVLPYSTMRFLKTNLWRMDFGESDLFFDVIYLPKDFLGLARYLVMLQERPVTDDIFFVVYVNTHIGVVPQWDLSELITITGPDGKKIKSNGWKVLYEDGQYHHRQGILTFPNAVKDGLEKGTISMTIELPDMRDRIFQWQLPVPPLPTSPEEKKQ